MAENGGQETFKDFAQISLLKIACVCVVVMEGGGGVSITLELLD